MPITGVPAFVVVLFTSLSILVYVTSGMSLSVVSSL
jgi:Na+-transporting methylmalonyl-CoA/oxaloacetate decarboxylase gamma subunit